MSFGIQSPRWEAVRLHVPFPLVRKEDCRFVIRQKGSTTLHARGYHFGACLCVKEAKTKMNNNCFNCQKNRRGIRYTTCKVSRSILLRMMFGDEVLLALVKMRYISPRSATGISCAYAFTFLRNEVGKQRELRRSRWISKIFYGITHVSTTFSARWRPSWVNLVKVTSGYGPKKDTVKLSLYGTREPKIWACLVDVVLRYNGAVNSAVVVMVEEARRSSKEKLQRSTTPLTVRARSGEFMAKAAILNAK